MTYRVGNHHGVTIVREPDQQAVCCNREDHDCTRGHLVAVVVNGDQALAARIVAQLNGAHTPDVDHTRGAAEALAQIAERIANAASDLGTDALATLRLILEATAAELGIDQGDDPEDGPCVGICAGCTPDCGLVGDSCSCTIVGPDPGCPVHHGRRARGPKPPTIGPGCACDGSGRTCPRHGAVT